MPLYIHIHVILMLFCPPLSVLPTILKGGYLDFSRLTELKNIYMFEIYLKKKKKKTQIINN